MAVALSNIIAAGRMNKIVLSKICVMLAKLKISHCSWLNFYYKGALNPVRL